LRAYRAVREAGALPDEAVLFLLDHAIQWTPTGGTEAVADDQAADEALDRRTLALLGRCGADDLAEMYVRDRLGYDRRRERGRQYFYGPPDAELAMRLREKGVID
jgi:hypothetical protein